MAISTNDGILKYGTQDTVSGTTTTVATGAWSTSGMASAWTNDDDAPMASAVLTWQYPSGTINTGGIQLACRLLNSDGTTDEPVPGTTWAGHFLDNFVTGTAMAATTNYAVTCGPFDLPSTKTSQEYEFYIQNSCGVTISASWTLKITPMAFGPHA